MSPEQRRQIIIMATLGLVLVGVVVWQFTRPAPEAQQAKEAAASATGKTTPSKPATAGKKPTPATKKPAASGSGDELPVEGIATDVAALVERVEPKEFDYDKLKITREPMHPLILAVEEGPQGPVPPVGGGDGGEGGGTPADINTRIKTAILGLVVTGILWDEAKPLAVVDNEVVSRGSILMPPYNITVTEIGPDYVKFKGGTMEPIPVQIKEQ